MTNETLKNNSIVFAVKTDKGNKRPKNEDSLWPQRNQPHPGQNSPYGLLFVIADGMGGHGAGDIASSLAVKVINETYYHEQNSETDISLRLEAAIRQAHQVLRDRATDSVTTEKMGTTVVAAVIKEFQLWIAWAGDSRAYLLRDSGGLEQLTQDDSEIWPLIKARHLTWDQLHTHPGRSRLTNALLARHQNVRINQRQLALQAGDQILLCTDGLTGEVRDKEIETILKNHAPSEAVKLLEKQAKADTVINPEGQVISVEGGKDNITSILIELPGQRVRPASASTQPLRWIAAGIIAVVILALGLGAAFFFGSPRSAATSISIPAVTLSQANSVGVLGEVTPTLIPIETTQEPTADKPGPTPIPGEPLPPTSTLAPSPTPIPRIQATPQPTVLPSPSDSPETGITPTYDRIILVNPEDKITLSSNVNQLEFYWRWDNNAPCNLPSERYDFEVRIYKLDQPPLGAMDALQDRDKIKCQNGVYSYLVGNLKSSPGVNGAASGLFVWDVRLVELKGSQDRPEVVGITVAEPRHFNIGVAGGSDSGGGGEEDTVFD